MATLFSVVKKAPKIFFVGALALFGTASLAADLATLQKLPLMSIDNLEYAGGFRFPTDVYGDSDVTYAQGAIALGAGGSSVYIVGHAQRQAIGEFRMPELVNSLKTSDFRTASLVQNFSRVLSRGETGNPQAIDVVAGMQYINGQLLVNGFNYYDASGGATHTTLVVKAASNLAGSAVGGFHSLVGRAHASGWISPVPEAWQSELGGPYITGHSSGDPIISRLSVGPSAFVFNPLSPSLGSLAPSSIPTTTLMDFSLTNPIGIGTKDNATYLNNSDRTNTLWNHLSKATYGFIVPGTRSYLTLGYTGGLTSGVGYKATQNNGNICSGYCAYDASDYYSYYWLFDMNDLLKVKSGAMKPYQVMPYSYGKFTRPHATNGFNAILGGAYDSAKGLLYLSLQRGEILNYGWAPTVVAFKVGTPSGNTTVAPPSPPSGGSASQL